jgi:molybdenum cofactor biosynthesis enzyme MoaA
MTLLSGDPAIETCTIALNYVCNSKCSFCFIERELDLRLPDTAESLIAGVFAENARRKRYKRLILAGAEATLRKDLPDIARRAHAEGGFEIVRLQTNGRRLGDRAYLDTLIAAGIGEYFVSIHAGTAELDAVLTRNKKSFAEMRAGVRQCVDAGVRIISNTCVVRGNHDQLGALADFLLEERVPESHFWAFLEFGDVGQGGEHVSYRASIPHLRAAVEKLRAAKRDVVLSWFPVCLLGDLAPLQKNHRDDTLIHDEFANRARAHGGFSCPHQASCPQFGKTCFGLHERYVELLGDERDVLRPIA